MKYILASASPRRREILSSLDFDFEVITSDVDESSDITEPSALVCELSRRKALAVRDAMHDNNRIIIACDTVVALNDQILGKPVDEADARNMLRDLSGDMHSVYSGLCLIKGNKIKCDFCCTDVYFDRLDKDDIDRYIASDEWTDKAGAYGIQGKAGMFVKKIDGCYFNVVGLPINLLKNMLKEF
ncbi:MAG: Maf family protein [Acutalibacteraceae bacterium]|nr:Maf family protein [Acutalibacteraceae bacterium]